jgi:putative ABC transport system permease protein
MLFALAIGGGLFICSKNVGISISSNTERLFENAPFNIEVGLSEYYSTDSIQKALSPIEQIESYETHTILSGFIQLDNNTRSNAFNIGTVDVNSSIAKVPLLKGEWLQNENEIVIDENLHVAHPEIEPGDKMIIQVEDQTLEFTLAGVIPVTAIPMKAMVADNAFAWRNPKLINNISVLSSIDTDDDYKNIKREIDQALETAGINIIKNQSLAEKKNISLQHDLMFADMFNSFSLIIGLVGILGLASTITTNVLERTKEIGILRSIGATGLKIFTMIQMEGLIIILMSWIFSVIFAIPLTFLFNGLLENILNLQSLPFAFDIQSIFLWLIIIAGAGTLVTSFPAYKAGSVEVQEAIKTL